MLYFTCTRKSKHLNLLFFITLIQLPSHIPLLQLIRLNHKSHWKSWNILGNCTFYIRLVTPFTPQFNSYLELTLCHLCTRTTPLLSSSLDLAQPTLQKSKPLPRSKTLYRSKTARFGPNCSFVQCAKVMHFYTLAQSQLWSKLSLCRPRNPLVAAKDQRPMASVPAEGCHSCRRLLYLPKATKPTESWCSGRKLPFQFLGDNYHSSG